MGIIEVAIIFNGKIVAYKLETSSSAELSIEKFSLRLQNEFEALLYRLNTKSADIQLSFKKYGGVIKNAQ